MIENIVEWNSKKWEQKNITMYTYNNHNKWPWFYDKLDDDVDNFLTKNKHSGNILDLGTCSGSQAIALTKFSNNVVGTDVSKTAVQISEGLAKEVVSTLYVISV
jgi:2-polyprenyl-3-methyl-5-hydroxy-6-metoxy-1,4-benzoquinol methylase